MQGYNVITVFDATGKKLLMCLRRKDPYKGLLNLVGGKIARGENGLTAAYRELEEETSIAKSDIQLTHLMDFTYYVYNCYVEVYFGSLNNPVTVSGDENDLLWVDADLDFFDIARFAGQGNIGHILNQIKRLSRVYVQNRHKLIGSSHQTHFTYHAKKIPNLAANV